MFFFRIIVERIAKNLHFFYFFLFLISIFLILLYLVLVISQGKTLFFPDKKSMFINVSRILIIFYRKLLKKLHKDTKKTLKEFILYMHLPKRIEQSYALFLYRISCSPNVLNIFYKLFLPLSLAVNEKYQRILYIIIFVLPKIIVSVIFFIDLVYFHQINYFYKSLWLLLIPLLGRIIRYTIRTFPPLRLDTLRDFVIAEEVPLEDNDIFSDELYILRDGTDYYYYNKKQNIKFKFFWVSQKEFSESDLFLLFFESLKLKEIFLFANNFYEIETMRFVQYLNLSYSVIMLINWSYIFLTMFALL